MRDDDRRDTAMARGENHAHDALAIHRIQRTRGFIGKQELVFSHDGTRDGYSLAFAT
jgi:hypothetical protein